MKLLLDTHIWLWSLLEPERLTAEVHSALTDSDNEIWLSPVTLWEVLILVEKGRVSLDSPADEWIAKALDAAPVHEAPLNFQVALESQRVDLPHRDPTDRFLAASAKVFGLALVTSDERLLELETVALLANR